MIRVCIAPTPPTSRGTTSWLRSSRRCSTCTRGWPRKACRTIPKGAALQRRIEMTDRQIDGLVYELYGLTAEEIAVAEGA
jgi:hypothetical protein